MPLLRSLLLAFLLTMLGQPLAFARQKNIFKIAFGSCSQQRDPDQMWADVIRQKPNLWMWVGDNVYADTHNMDSLRAYYAVQKKHPGYRQMLQSFPIIGIWDDHDYGMNDGGKFFSMKKGSKEQLLDFLDVPKNAEVRTHEGVYQSFLFEEGRIKIILLDTRYFRDTLFLSKEKGKKYTMNPEGDVLGEDQWAWLEKELKNSKASLNIIASSIQFLANEHIYEKWGNFPKARQRMLDLLARIKPTNTLFVSGDRHMAEISKMNLKGLSYPLYDFTSSGLTHTWEKPWVESNALRVGELIIQKNFGMITVEWVKKKPMVTLRVCGKNNVVYAEEKIVFPQTK